MAKNYNQSCDNCGTILYGQDRGAFVKKTNIFINGQVGKNVVDPETEWHDVVYMTKAKDQQSCYCDTECLREWMETQEELWNNRKKAKLREEAEYGITGQERPHTGFNARPAWSSGPEPERRPYKKFGTPPANAPSHQPPAPAPKHVGYGGHITEPRP